MGYRGRITRPPMQCINCSTTKTLYILCVIQRSRFTALSKKSLPPTLCSFFCPHCSTPHTPHTSSQHTVGRRRLKSLRRRAKLKGRDIPCVPTPSLNTKRYVVSSFITCLICTHDISYTGLALQYSDYLH